ncbi:MAG: DNA polymerase III subunit alpha [Bacteroidales bacterium]|nr:DNA polymerase III subunit alpha [Bacteroidales bacterium]MDD4673046.1 DNA polymerase III subunit alpha [Bacteroidales bacterium]
MSKFVHLHVHTQYSILDGASSIKGLIDKAISLGMRGIAITDHGNMFGVKEFVNTVSKANQSHLSEIKRLQKEIDSAKNSDTSEELKIKLAATQQKLFKPIIGCEAYVTTDRKVRDKNRRGGDHLVLLAKNLTGYHNLTKMVSYSWTEGFYQRPRIDKELLRKYGEGIVVSSACLGGEIPQAIIKGNEAKAEEIIYEFKEIFGDDFYLEVMLHPVKPGGFAERTYQEQKRVNEVIFKLAAKTGVKCIATNDIHFINAEDAQAHDRLICLNTGKEVDDPNRLHYTMQEYLKSEDEMLRLFPNHPEAIYNTEEILNKIEIYSLDHDPIMPEFGLPDGFTDDNEYLRHLTYKGAEVRWGKNLSDEIKERLDFELEVIKSMGFPSYFLIVWDFLVAAREMDVSVGPGRGSAAGSAVAYCLKITDIDPLRYGLLFERFLNPERISMPDIDIDFDEDGREQVMNWVVNKYGKNRVAHIITFGTMAAKMAIRDVARVQRLPLPEAMRIAKLVPERPGITLAQAYKEVPELLQCKNSPNELVKSTLQYAEVLEGSVRQTGVHACGIIIGRNNLEEHIPICINKDAELYVTQYDGKHVEDIGLLKMDFLGLKTLSIIKDALQFIKESKGIDVDIDHVALDDKKTFELYSRGDTTALFQFESPGMKKHLRALKPSRFEDLIAMNALYRPGPIEYIPNFIKRKHGREKIEYDLPEMKEILEETYGITVYQEQVMRLSQKLADFTRGEADSLRKAMGKKQKTVMDKLKAKFIKGCLANGYEEKRIEKIWGDWEKFAQYAFNKSHSTCYAFVSFQTAYLKAHYPSQFMAAVLSRNLSDIKKITLFMDECRRMGAQVLGPDVNHSNYKFTVMDNGDIRFGLGAIKGVGEGAVINIIETRKAGSFKDVYDFVERVNLQTVSKKNIENLVLAGALDNLSDIKREQYFAPDAKGVTFIENLSRYGAKVQTEKNNVQQTLFGGMESGFELQKPEPVEADSWSNLEYLSKEKDLIGIYLSAHPLDDFKFEVDNFTNTSLSELYEPAQLNGRDISVAGIVSEAKILPTKKGTHYGRITIEDFTDSYEFTLFGNNFETYRPLFYVGYPLLVKGRFSPNRFRQGELEFNIKSMQTLSTLREDLVKKITLSLFVDDINEELVQELKTLTTNHPGNVNLRIRVIDLKSHVNVELFSRTYRVNVGNELIEHLNKMDISYKIN